MPPPAETDMTASGGSNSSDFVRKLYKMLEDPAYEEIVRWGNEGTSFVVLENEKFTKSILPKHFKHSNFASFVRQLNKYDFHKVRHTEDTGQAPYGQGAWEFKHPEFRANMKDNLDNIRRKAPAPRKAATSVEDPSFPNTQQLGMMTESLTATLQQVAGLQDQYAQLVQTNKTLVEEILSLQKTVKAQNQVHHELLNYLDNLDERRRNSKHANASNSSHHQGFHSGVLGMLPDSGDEPAPELRRARDTLHNAHALLDNAATGRDLERLSLAFQSVSSPPDSTTSSAAAMFTQNPPQHPQHPHHLQQQASAAAGGAMSSVIQGIVPDPFGDPRHLVYPMGQNQGIDPFHADHIRNIPYTQPPVSQALEAPSQITTPPSNGSRISQGPIWLKKPRILLVEDDRVCSRIGSKFLSQVDCDVEVADDGMIAVTKFNNSDPDRYQLIFMDIIMPNLDGVSASTCIRSENGTVPIIAMTSNIRQEDLATYFNFGMNDVLAKPFTKEGMVRILKKHLSHLLRNPPPEELFTADVATQAQAAAAYAANATVSPAAAAAGPPAGTMSINTMTMPPVFSKYEQHAHQHGPGGGSGPSAPSASQQQQHGIAKFEAGGGPSGTPSGESPSIKFEPGPGGPGGPGAGGAPSLHSPSTTTGSWNSPASSLNHQPSPQMDGSGGFMLATVGPGGGGPGQAVSLTAATGPRGGGIVPAGSRVMKLAGGDVGVVGPGTSSAAALGGGGGVDDRPEKRQRMYGGPGFPP